MRAYQKFPPPWPRAARWQWVLQYLRARSTLTESGCWVWTGAVQSSGYGIAKVGGRVVTVHRLALAARLGLEGKRLGERYACHEGPSGCVKLCCCPDHLEPGSQSRNMRHWARSRAALRPQEVAV